MPLTTGDLAAHLELDAPPTGVAGVEFARFLTAAVQGVTKRTGWLDATQGTARVPTTWRERWLRLPFAHLASVDRVLDPSGAVVVPYLVDELAGLVEVTVPALGTWQVTCTGTPWPAELSVAALDWAGHLYETQRTTVSAVRNDENPTPTFSVPNRVLELITPHLLPGMA
jgi:hypothetical protein